VLPLAVIFDMDGLMLDTESLGARAWEAVAAERGIAFDAAVTPQLIGRSAADCRELIRARHGADYPVDALMDGWDAAFEALVAREGLAIKPGVTELLDWLAARAIPRAVATSTRRGKAIAKLEATGLWPRLAHLVGGDEVARGKPAPDIFLVAARRLGVAPTRCLVLEDSTPGLLGAAAAGIPAIMVPDLCEPPSEVAGRPPRVMATLHEVRDWLASLA